MRGRDKRLCRDDPLWRGITTNENIFCKGLSKRHFRCLHNEGTFSAQKPFSERPLMRSLIKTRFSLPTQWGNRPKAVFGATPYEGISSHRPCRRTGAPWQTPDKTGHYAAGQIPGAHERESVSEARGGIVFPGSWKPSSEFIPPHRKEAGGTDGGGRWNAP